MCHVENSTIILLLRTFALIVIVEARYSWIEILSRRNWSFLQLVCRLYADEKKGGETNKWDTAQTINLRYLHGNRQWFSTNELHMQRFRDFKWADEEIHRSKSFLLRQNSKSYGLIIGWLSVTLWLQKSSKLSQTIGMIIKLWNSFLIESSSIPIENEISGLSNSIAK